MSNFKITLEDKEVGKTSMWEPGNVVVNKGSGWRYLLVRSIGGNDWKQYTGKVTWEYKP